MQKESERRISHAVYMGMGEPLWNYENVIKSLRLLGNEVGVSLRNLTVSTVGVVPGIRALAKEELPITLALSLHAPNDELRAQLIPTARKWKLDEILDACGEYARNTHRNLTFEYLLIGGVNDKPEHARELATSAQSEKTAGQRQPDPVQLCGNLAGLSASDQRKRDTLPAGVGKGGTRRHAAHDARPCHRRRLRPTAPQCRTKWRQCPARSSP